MSQLLPGRDWTVIFLLKNCGKGTRGPREDEGDAVDLHDTLSRVSSLGPRDRFEHQPMTSKLFHLFY